MECRSQTKTSWKTAREWQWIVALERSSLPHSCGTEEWIGEWVSRTMSHSCQYRTQRSDRCHFLYCADCVCSIRRRSFFRSKSHKLTKMRYISRTHWRVNRPKCFIVSALEYTYISRASWISLLNPVSAGKFCESGNRMRDVCADRNWNTYAISEWTIKFNIDRGRLSHSHSQMNFANSFTGTIRRTWIHRCFDANTQSVFVSVIVHDLNSKKRWSDFRSGSRIRFDDYAFRGKSNVDAIEVTSIENDKSCECIVGVLCLWVAFGATKYKSFSLFTVTETCGSDEAVVSDNLRDLFAGGAHNGRASAEL